MKEEQKNKNRIESDKELEKIRQERRVRKQAIQKYFDEQLETKITKIVENVLKNKGIN